MAACAYLQNLVQAKKAKKGQKWQGCEEISKLPLQGIRERMRIERMQVVFRPKGKCRQGRGREYVFISDFRPVQNYKDTFTAETSLFSDVKARGNIL
jgi:hypothetical protein